MNGSPPPPHPFGNTLEKVGQPDSECGVEVFLPGPIMAPPLQSCATFVHSTRVTHTPILHSLSEDTGLQTAHPSLPGLSWLLHTDSS